jgi:hypothetical protein
MRFAYCALRAIIGKGSSREKEASVLRQLALASFIVLAPQLASAQSANFRIEEATIEDIQAAILRGERTSTRVVQLYLDRIRAYNGTCVNQPDGVLGLGPITPIKNAHQLNALMTLKFAAGQTRETGVRSAQGPQHDQCGR